jgi:hypothetical protein
MVCTLPSQWFNPLPQQFLQSYVFTTCKWFKRRTERTLAAGRTRVEAWGIACRGDKSLDRLISAIKRWRARAGHNGYRGVPHGGVLDARIVKVQENKPNTAHERA